MPITYQIHNGGHVINAIASGNVTRKEFVEFEVAHATDECIRSPVSELFLIESTSLKGITMSDMRMILERREALDPPPIPHRCAIVVQLSDTHSWNLAKFYEGMVMLHSPESVIVFGDEKIARIWLGIKPVAPRIWFQ